MKNLTKIFVVVLAALLLAGFAHAIPITGTVKMAGFGFSAFDPLTATYVPTPSAAFVTSATGDFDTYFNFLSPVTYHGFEFASPSSPVANPLWSAAGFFFVLESVSVVSRTAQQLVLSGLGTLSKSGFDPTAGSWGITLSSIGKLQFNFSNTTAATAAPVPEPATALLLGVGLLASSVFARRKFRKR